MSIHVWVGDLLGEVGDTILRAPIHSTVPVPPAEVTVPSTVVPVYLLEVDCSGSISALLVISTNATRIESWAPFTFQVAGTF